MKRLIIILLFLMASVWLGLLAMRHPGFLLIVWQPWMVQMPIWFAALGLLVIFGLFYFIVDGIDQIGFLCFRLKSWLHLRRKHKSYSKTQHGLAALIEGRYKRAEKLLLAGVNQSMDPLINYLAAAEAAHELHAYDRRDKYIQQAYALAPRAKLAIGLTQAKLALKGDQLEQAIATLNNLQRLSPRHPRVLSLMEKVYVRLADWKNLQTLLPALRRARVMNEHDFETFEKNIYCEMFRSASDKRLSEVRAIWNDVPRSLKKQTDVLTAYVSQLAKHAPITGAQTTKEMQELIHKALKNGWYPELAKIYGKLTFADLNKQLVIVGAWLKMYGQQPELLLILGNTCARLQLWGKAKEYFAKCLQQGPNAEATLAYGRLLESLGESEEALQKYREGLALLS